MFDDAAKDILFEIGMLINASVPRSRKIYVCWAESLGSNICRLLLPSFAIQVDMQVGKNSKKSVKRWLARAGFNSSKWTPPLPENNVLEVREHLL